MSRWKRKKIAKIVPDFIVEVRSPTDNPEKLKAKIEAEPVLLERPWLLEQLKKL